MRKDYIMFPSVNLRLIAQISVIVLSTLAQAQNPILVEVPHGSRTDCLNFFFDIYSQSVNKNNFKSVDDYDWIGGQSPEQRFFDNWQEMVNHDSSLIPENRSKLFLMNRETIVASWQDHVLQKGDKIFLRRSFTNCCDQEILPNGELEKLIVQDSKRNNMTVESRVIQIDTDQGPIRSQVIKGAAHQISAESLIAQIQHLIEFARMHNKKITGVVIRHLHPSPEFHDVDRKTTQLFFYNNKDFQVMRKVSQHFPNLRFYDGATVPNGHTYQVEFSNGRQISPSVE